MAKAQKSTRDTIVAAAEKLFYAEGIRAVSVDAVAEAAGVTKRTLYYHFESKDELIAAYLEGRDQPNLKLFQTWFSSGEGDLATKVEAVFVNLARAARHPKWKGCGFLRTSAELANMPGHPAIRIGAAHKKKFEAWMAETFAEAGAGEPDVLAKQILLLLDGSFAVVLLHRDPGYMETAGRAAATLVRVALGGAHPRASSERAAASF
ncbi:helix-turn-helix domain-containing protein [Ensifer sp.]|jgi:AcrR family transcriptional regulator|uniref:TetR/AcrR family transcriptional regulator n=1 Tax=Ensifer sp. TaxID=1872086 RepID=UPI002E15D673|nr:helix-turn-helix domain-containing protein [Ensifer sp.]